VIGYGVAMRRSGVSTLLLALAVLVLAVPTSASAVRLVRVAGGFDSPVHATASPRGSALYVVEQQGQIWRLGSGGGRSLFLDIRRQVGYGGERGLFSVAFSPDYASSRYLYVNYTDNGGDVRVARFRANSSFSHARRSTRTMLLDVEHSSQGNHNGGQVVFGPNGRLYVSVGDGGGSCDPGGNAQDLSTRKGKLLSLDTDTPSAGWRIDGYGLRNTWRFAFDRSTGRLYAADVGQGSREEVNTLSAGRLGGTPENYLWDRYEGRRSSGCSTGGLQGPGDHIFPVHAYSHSVGCSITGGHVYRGTQLPSRLRGWYFFGDYCSGRIWRLKVNDDGDLVGRARLVQNTSLNVSSFGVRRSGELLVVDRGGAIYKLAR
jgi:glucose/arabinose dehydrogenase